MPPWGREHRRGPEHMFHEDTDYSPPSGNLKHHRCYGALEH